MGLVHPSVEEFAEVLAADRPRGSWQASLVEPADEDDLALDPDELIAGWEEQLRHDEGRGDLSAGAAVFGAVRTYLVGTGARDAEWSAHRTAVGALLAQNGLAQSEIARRLSCSVDTVGRDLELYGRLRGARRLRRVEARRAE